jgi:DNA replicative helicase MCM subunit Mcm2 (Cdc46/Mcm family)
MSQAEEPGANPNTSDSQENIIRTSFGRFLRDYVDDSTQRVYQGRVEDMKKNWGTTLNVDYGHLLEYDAELATEITTEYCRYEPFLKVAVMDFVKQMNPNCPGPPGAFKHP